MQLYIPVTETGAESEGWSSLMVRWEVSNGYDSSPQWKAVLLVPVETNFLSVKQLAVVASWKEKKKQTKLSPGML